MIHAAPLRAHTGILVVLDRFDQLDTFLAPEMARFFLIHQPNSLQIGEQGDNLIYRFRRKSREIEYRMLPISEQKDCSMIAAQVVRAHDGDQITHIR
jgi:hypothetical protein